MVETFKLSQTQVSHSPTWRWSGWGRSYNCSVRALASEYLVENSRGGGGGFNHTEVCHYQLQLLTVLDQQQVGSDQHLRPEEPRRKEAIVLGDLVKDTCLAY